MLEKGYNNIIKFVPKRNLSEKFEKNEGVVINFFEGKKRRETYKEIERLYLKEKGETIEEVIAEFDEKGLDLKIILNKMTDFVLSEFETEAERDLKLYQFTVALKYDEFIKKNVSMIDFSLFMDKIVATIKKFLEIKK
ncbi:MAG TPA: hypothetical protein PK831_00240 [Candidatus Magasanikbacteria bacterium]|jgi:hypothetical protein|nr:hypothetical protein [Candidatus Magasanikbacteria bacterium]HQF56924.1 hypothetical protein [Candidatus Magasanikbacteria bacterium]HQL52792.1 hypothetical protein [Candidatus Magasanikbacteria bacterium]